MSIGLGGPSATITPHFVNNFENKKYFYTQRSFYDRNIFYFNGNILLNLDDSGFFFQIT